MTDEAFPIPLASIVRHASFQVRTQLDAATVNRYAFAMKAEAPMPPVVVARIVPPGKVGRGNHSVDHLGIPEGTLVLVSGYHRCAAAEQNGQRDVLAVVKDCTLREALGEAAVSNLAHGLPLTAKEVRNAFGLFIRAGRYRDAKGDVKSLREIGREFGRPHQTVTRWAKHHKFYWFLRLYGQEDKPTFKSPDDPEEMHPMEPLAVDAMDILKTTGRAAPEMTPQQRWRIVESLDALRATLEGLGVTEPAPDGF